jgi:hypothetical protein
MKTISGYELSVIFDSKELTKTQINILMEEIHELFEDSDIVSAKLEPIVEDD